MKFKAVIKDKSPIHYVSEGDVVKFVDKNSDMGWNECCDFVRDNGITSEDGDQTLWCRSDIMSEKANKHYSDVQIHWLKGFFEAHPFISQAMFVFDD